MCTNLHSHVFFSSTEGGGIDSDEECCNTSCLELSNVLQIPLAITINV